MKQHAKLTHCDVKITHRNYIFDISVLKKECIALPSGPIKDIHSSKLRHVSAFKSSTFRIT